MSTYRSKAFASKLYAESSFALHGLDGISDAQIAEHLGLYAGYVKQVNALNDDLAAMIGHGLAGKNPTSTGGWWTDDSRSRAFTGSTAETRPRPRPRHRF